MLYRGGKLTKYSVESEGTWSSDDLARALTLEARWRAHGIDGNERRRLLPCAVTLLKWPGIRYNSEIMEKLSELLGLR